jgi:hypothetical protein
MHSIVVAAAAKLAFFHLEQNDTVSIAVIKKYDPLRVSASLMLTLLLPLLTLLYLELARSQSYVVQAPVSLQRFPNLNCVVHSGGETFSKEEPLLVFQKKVTWVANSPHLTSRAKSSEIHKLQIIVPAPPPVRSVRRTSIISPVQVSTPKLSNNDLVLCKEECLLKLVEETLAYVQMYRPWTEEFRLLITKLEQFAAWNAIKKPAP